VKISPVRRGQRFGRLTVLCRAKRRILWFAQGRNRSRFVYKCRCDCGRVVSYSSGRLTSGNRKSCGIGECRTRTSGLYTKAHYPKYRRALSKWRSMHARCENPKQVGYQNYGGAGIKVCARWSGWPQGFMNFYADLFPRPRRKTLDRINPFGDYTPRNVRWATKRQQNNNYRIHYAAAHPKDPLVIAGLKRQQEFEQAQAKRSAERLETEAAYWAEGKAVNF
jgi:hypothetical protein